jgi:hypothetical protein
MLIRWRVLTPFLAGVAAAIIVAGTVLALCYGTNEGAYRRSTT